MSENPDPIDDQDIGNPTEPSVPTENPEASSASAENTTIVVADSVLPPILPVIPLFDRPLFPRMMAPIVLTNNEQTQALLNAAQTSS